MLSDLMVMFKFCFYFFGVLLSKAYLEFSFCEIHRKSEETELLNLSKADECRR